MSNETRYGETESLDATYCENVLLVLSMLVVNVDRRNYMYKVLSFCSSPPLDTLFVAPVIPETIRVLLTASGHERSASLNTTAGWGPSALSSPMPL